MGLANRAVKGTIIVATSTYLIDIISVIRSIILARLLVPEYFGIVALASFFFNIFRQLKEFNFDFALIYKSDSSDEDFSTHFVLKIILAIITFLILAAISPFLTNFYGPDIVKIILIFAFFSIFQEGAATPRIVLEKELFFGRVAFINIVKELIRTIIPIIMALKGFGLWSLVAVAVLDMSIPLLGYIITKTWKFSFHFNKDTVIWLFKYSSYMWLAGICITLMYQFDDFLVGALIGMVALGFYVKAYEFSKLPTQLITHIINRVSLPLYSKLREKKTELSRAFNNFLYFIFRFTLPFAFSLFIIAPEFVDIFLGSKWSGTISLLRLLIIYSILRPIQDDCSVLLYGLGRPKLISNVVLIQAIMMVLLAPFFVYFLGVNGAAIFVDLMTIVGIILIYRKISNFVTVEYIKNFFAPIISALSALSVIFIIMRTIYIDVLINRLIIKLLLFTSIYTMVLVLLTKEELFSKFKYVFDLLRKNINYEH
jgi:O-antigen/teichoic acid export membrane protein